MRTHKSTVDQQDIEDNFLLLIVVHSVWVKKIMALKSKLWKGETLKGQTDK